MEKSKTYYKEGLFMNTAEIWELDVSEGSPHLAQVRIPHEHTTLLMNISRARAITCTPQMLEALADNAAVMEQALKIVDAYREAALGDGDISAMNIRALLRRNRALIARAMGDNSHA